jgi:hypothetical protein
MRSARRMSTGSGIQSARHMRDETWVQPSSRSLFARKLMTVDSSTDAAVPWRKEDIMARKKKYNPERRAWRGRSYKAYGTCIRALREKLAKKDRGQQG